MQEENKSEKKKRRKQNRMQLYGYTEEEIELIYRLALDNGFLNASGYILSLIRIHLMDLNAYQNKTHAGSQYKVNSLQHNKNLNHLGRKQTVLIGNYRFLKEDGEKIIKEARSMGYKPTQYIRSIVQNHVRKNKIKPIGNDLMVLLQQSNVNLERIGRNINQIAKVLNAEGVFKKDELTIEKLDELKRIIENHTDKVNEILIENQEVYNA